MLVQYLKYRIYRCNYSKNQKSKINRHNNTNGFFSDTGPVDLSSITIKDSQICDVSENVVKLTHDFFGERNYAYDTDSRKHMSEVEDTRLMEDPDIEPENLWELGGNDLWKKRKVDKGEDQEWNTGLKRSTLTVEAEEVKNIRGGKKRSGWFLCCW